MVLQPMTRGRVAALFCLKPEWQSHFFLGPSSQSKIELHINAKTILIRPSW